jgi:hypothetical protein
LCGKLLAAFADAAISIAVGKGHCCGCKIQPHVAAQFRMPTGQKTSNCQNKTNRRMSAGGKMEE